MLSTNKILQSSEQKTSLSDMTCEGVLRDRETTVTFSLIRSYCISNSYNTSYNLSQKDISK